MDTVQLRDVRRSSPYPHSATSRLSGTDGRAVTMRSLEMPASLVGAAESSPLSVAATADGSAPELATSLRAAGQFELVHCVGRGKTGAVWRARHPRVGRDVALKILSHTVDVDVARERLEREARLSAQVRSDAVAHIYDVAEDHAGRPCLVMQLFEGKTLASLLAPRSPLGLERSVRLIKQIARALDEIHESAIVHCDLKPEDIIVTRGTNRGGRIKIIDFGDAQPPTEASGVDARSDVSALSEIAYRCLTGRRPSHEHVALASRYDDALPRAVDAVLSRALSPNARDRFSHAGELASALEEASQPRARRSPPRSPQKARELLVTPVAATPSAPEPRARLSARGASATLAVLLVALVAGGIAGRVWKPARAPLPVLSAATQR